LPGAGKRRADLTTAEQSDLLDLQIDALAMVGDLVDLDEAIESGDIIPIPDDERS
jgi:hypothetical protein